MLGTPRQLFLALLLFWTVLLRASVPFPLFFQLDWHPNAQFAGLLLAQERGWYREANLEVTFLPIGQEPDAVHRVVAGTNWLGCAESSVLVSARASGAPIRAIGTMLQAGPLALISLKSNRITNLCNLVGKKLGIRNEGLAAIQVVLKHDGWKTDQFIFTEKDQTIQQLLDGSCDAVQGYLIDEAIELETKGVAIQTIPYYEHGYHSYSQVYFTSETMLRDHRRELRKFLEVSRRGWQAALLAPEEAANVVVHSYAPSLDVVYQRRSLASLARLATIESGFEGMGWMSPETWTRILETIYNSGVIHHPLAVSDIADFSIFDTSSCRHRTQLPTRNFLESGGLYPAIILPTDMENRSLPRSVEMVVAVSPAGIAETAMLLQASTSHSFDSRIINEVTQRWRWPAGTWRQFRIQVPLTTHRL